MKRDVVKPAEFKTAAPAVLVEHECKLRGEPVPAIRRKDGAVECVAADVCSESKNGRCTHGAV